MRAKLEIASKIADAKLVSKIDIPLVYVTKDIAEEILADLEITLSVIKYALTVMPLVYKKPFLPISGSVIAAFEIDETQFKDSISYIFGQSLSNKEETLLKKQLTVLEKITERLQYYKKYLLLKTKDSSCAAVVVNLAASRGEIETLSNEIIERFKVESANDIC